MRLYVLLWSEKYHHVHASFISIVRPLFAQAQPGTAGQPPTCPAVQLCLVPFTGSCAALSKVCWPKLVRAGVPPETGKVWNVFPYSSPFSSRSETHLQSAHIASVRVRSGFRLVPPQRAGMLLQWCGVAGTAAAQSSDGVQLFRACENFFATHSVPLLPNY
jgi:hypothetical protein